MKKKALHLLLLLSAIVLSTGFTSCDDDDDDYYPDMWYLTGTWQCMQYPDETLDFYSDGTGMWQNTYTGEYEEFDYNTHDYGLWFYWDPAYGAPYTEDCSIYVVNRNAMSITYPPSYDSGPVTLNYSRLY